MAGIKSHRNPVPPDKQVATGLFVERSAKKSFPDQGLKATAHENNKSKPGSRSQSGNTSHYVNDKLRRGTAKQRKS